MSVLTTDTPLTPGRRRAQVKAYLGSWLTGPGPKRQVQWVRPSCIEMKSYNPRLSLQLIQYFYFLRLELDFNSFCKQNKHKQPLLI